MELTAENVHNTFEFCLYQNGDSVDDVVDCSGVLGKVYMNQSRVWLVKSDIISMLDKLCDKYRSTNGYSFLNMCEDKHGRRWTEYYQIVDELVMLGLAIHKVSFAASKSRWDMFIGGMPHIVIDQKIVCFA